MKPPENQVFHTLQKLKNSIPKLDLVKEVNEIIEAPKRSLVKQQEYVNLYK